MIHIPASVRRGLGLLLLFLCLSAPLNAQTSAPASSEGEQTAGDLLAFRELMDQVLWTPEVVAQQHEARFVQLWDALLGADDAFSILAAFPFSALELGQKEADRKLDLGIGHTRFVAGGPTYTPDEWQTALARFKAAGYRIEQTEWHHSAFEPAHGEEGARSVVSAVLHAARDTPAHRMIVRATLRIEWAVVPDAEGQPVPETIHVEQADVFERQAPPAFSEVFRVNSTAERPLVLPLLVYDLNQDGLSEIMLLGQNMVIWNRGQGRFEAETLLPDDRLLYDHAVLADFNGDGAVDLIGVDDTGSPLLFPGDPDGRFRAPPRKAADVHFGQAKAFTAGDIDGDGDLDLFIANYKSAYNGGQMPTPYFDANDGHPAALLQNQGDGTFVDVTAAAGLAPKRFRRTYSTSLVDLDDDLDLDLIVVSDFAGLDWYRNDGAGHFEDVTGMLGDDRHSFGMAHTLADYNLDGQLDLYVIGMSSTTARRLEQLGIGREDKPGYDDKRMLMGYGNRMFLLDQGVPTLAPFNDDVARTGWSWGTSSFDLENDGDPDIAVANGHVSGQSTQDYCTTFWRHDIYTDGSEADAARDTVFQVSTTELRRNEISWNGYEHNELLLNQSGTGFVDVAYLMGTAFEYDARALVTDDLDADGRMDMLVVESISKGEDRGWFTLHIYRNELPTAGHWIGVRLPEGGPGRSPIGATVRLITASGTQIKRMVTGDSFSAQHAATAHFGLGAQTAVEAIEIQWPNGTTRRLDAPAVDQYHTVE